MKYTLVVRKEAKQDLREAVDWYERQREGLGQSFLDSVEEVLERILRHPTLYACFYRNVRIATVKKFPYLVCYILKENDISVIAVIHGHRDPSTWQSRT